MGVERIAAAGGGLTAVTAVDLLIVGGGWGLRGVLHALPAGAEEGTKDEQWEQLEAATELLAAAPIDEVEGELLALQVRGCRGRGSGTLPAAGVKRGAGRGGGGWLLDGGRWAGDCHFVGVRRSRRLCSHFLF